MKQLHERFGASLEILLYPSDEFGAEEFPEEAQVAEFVTKKGLPTNAPGFHLMGKVMTNGAGADPVWQLAKQAFPGEVEWNFAGIFLFDKEGECVSRSAILEDPPTEETIVSML